MGVRKQIACGIVYLQADMVLTEDPVDTVIAVTSDDVLAIRASKMPRMRGGEAWDQMPMSSLPWCFRWLAHGSHAEQRPITHGHKAMHIGRFYAYASLGVSI